MIMLYEKEGQPWCCLSLISQDILIVFNNIRMYRAN